MFSGFTFAIGAHSISEEVSGFSPLWFPQGKLFVSLMIISVHVILSDKILDHIGIIANLRRRHYVAIESRASYFVGLSPHIISKRRLG